MWCVVASCAVLCNVLEIVAIAVQNVTCVVHKRLRWYGHVCRMLDAKVDAVQTICRSKLSWEDWDHLE